METFEFRYSLAHRKENKNKKEELLIMNYQLPREQEENNILSELLDSV